MDLNKFDSHDAEQQGTFMQLSDPISGAALKTEEGEPIGIVLLGPGSDKVKSISYQIQNRRVSQQFKANRKGGDGLIKAEQLVEDEVATVAAATVDFVNVVLEGSEVDVSKAASLYERFPWIREQAIEHMNALENYLGN